MGAPSDQGYTPTETLYHDGRTTLFRAVRPGDARSVVLKVLDPNRCRPQDLQRLRHEYETGASLDLEAAVKPLAIETWRGMPALVLEDPGGQPLDRLLEGPMPLARFLDVAIRLARAVADVHDRGVVHKDLKPANVLVQPSGDVKLVDFGIATRLPREPQAPRPPALIEGSLPYMSPEQTGRMNRALDSRSDLYSLGVTFFQLITGRLPFEATHPQEWIHCHVARAPPSPASFVRELPEVVERIVLKLLGKMAEDRYQTARGLAHDLERCREQWRDRGRIEAFPLGERDLPARLQIPQRLYGREREVADLLRAFERVADRGAPELVLVSGYSGIGKSSLVHELEKPILGRSGLFATGKFEPYKRDVPYSTLVAAFGALVLDLLAEDEERVAAWRHRLKAALGRHGRLVVDVIPQVELLVGPQPAVPELPLGEAKERFQAVFRRFVGVFARRDHPLTLFLDDLQWADSASLELLASVLASPETRHLLAVGAYRENEVGPAHPLMLTLGGLRRTALPVLDVVLAPLSREHLARLVADATRSTREDAAALTTLVEEKTAGNPFFAIQFLSSLQEDGLLRLDPQALAWRLDLERARARGYTDNVVDLMVAKLRRLPAEAQEAVTLASCIGNVADVRTLAVLRARPEDQTHHDLSALVREGLLDRSGEAYRFSHDRVHQAAHALVPEDRRARIHLEIGRLLRAHTPPGHLADRVFEIANHLNRGASLIADPEERSRLAELDLLAGRRALASSAPASAAQYLAAGVAVLPPAAWAERHPLAFGLHLEQARCGYLLGAFDEAERHVELALRHAATLAEKADCHRLRIEVRTMNGEVEQAIDAVLECAALFGVAFERHAPPESVQERFDAILRALGDRTIEQLVDLPPTGDPGVRSLVEALVAAIPIAYQHDLTLPFALTCEAVRLTIEHGWAPSSAHALGLVGMLIGPYLGRYRTAYRFGKVGFDLCERIGTLEHKAGIAASFGAYTLLWTRPVNDGVAVLEAGVRAGAEVGDLRDACYCATALVSALLARGDPLDEVDRRSAEMLAFVRGAKLGFMEDNLLAQRRLVHRLRGGPSPPAPAEDEGLDARVEQRVPLTRCAYWIRELQGRFFFGEYAEALAAAARAQELMWTSMCSWERCEHSYFLALALAATCPEAPSRERDARLDAIRAEAERHRPWAESCPESFRNRHALVSAELARLEGRELEAERLYEEAIRSAAKGGFVQNEALAYEVAAAFHGARGRDLIASTYLREARGCYVRWAADGKVRRIDELHPRLLEVRAPVPAATFVARSEHLDLLSVARAAQTISSEMEMERLAGTLLQVVLEQGAARRGLLLLSREGELSVAAEASIEGGAVETRRVAPLPLEPCSGAAGEPGPPVPASVVHYVQATRQPVILEDASAGSGKLASDPYFARHRTKSALCLPIVRRDLVGLLYLENDLVAGAFTPDRLTALSLLASQAAISLEITRLLGEERQARQRSAFLAEAGALLAESLDPAETLGRLGRLCVRSLADWCVIDLLEGRAIRRVAGACADPTQEPLLAELRARHPPRWDSPHPAAQCLRTGEPIWVVAFTEERLQRMSEDADHLRLLHALGTRSLVAVPLSARGEVIGALSVCAGTSCRYGAADLDLVRELAQRAAIALENARLYREAQRAVRLRDEFLQVASHELRTPIAALTLSLGTLLDARRPGLDLGPEVRRLTEVAARQGTRLSRLVEEIIDGASDETGWPTLKVTEIELGAVARGVAERFRGQLARAGCPLSVRCDRPLVGRWDGARLDQVLANLVSNALKFGAGRPIEIEVGEDGGTARVTVRDHGIGIDRSHHATIFDRFHRAVSPEHYGGLGLGLYVSRRIVEAHGGSIGVESQLGEGATFTIELPCARDDLRAGGAEGERRWPPGQPDATHA